MSKLAFIFEALGEFFLRLCDMISHRLLLPSAVSIGRVLFSVLQKYCLHTQ